MNRSRGTTTTTTTKRVTRNSEPLEAQYRGAHELDNITAAGQSRVEEKCTTIAEAVVRTTSGTARETVAITCTTDKIVGISKGGASLNAGIVEEEHGAGDALVSIGANTTLARVALGVAAIA